MEASGVSHLLMEAFRGKSPPLLLAESVSGVSDRKSGRLASS